MGAAELLQSLSVEPHFCAVVAESSFSSFREIAYDRMGQPFRLGPWFGRTLLRPVIEFAFLYVRWRHQLDMQQVSPENALAATTVPVFLIHGQIDSQHPGTPFAPHPIAKSESSSLGSPQRRSLRSHKRSPKRVRTARTCGVLRKAA
jgi:pimeloyl-ACP methyl ester carboxylesterase